MGLNIDKMISHFGMLTFFSFLREWFIYGLIFFLIILIFENINIWLLRRELQHMENENIDLKIRLKDLRRKTQNDADNNDRTKSMGNTKN